MEAPEDASMMESSSDPVQLKPFELLDDIANAGSAHLFRQVQADLGKHLQEFERAGLRTSLSVPAGLILDQAALAEGGPKFTAEDEQRVDGQLATLRQEIQQARQARQDVEAQMAAIDREIKSYGDPSQLAAITEAVAGKENLAEDARALAEKAVQLAALLPRVRAKQAQRDAAAADSAAAANSKQAALLAEKDILQRKAAVSKVSMAELRSLREQLQMDT
ncbi:hypothetical protein COCSUDRAFT_59376 [Coccomyxa subellipsoidea C-169]|uniref:Uncharacterized protein n=1 Tax=Coccomyxa subellipsoidea (strain C-169) TaxID=574566 RepID=I0Z8A0_COCSC|nr:hypothetical protein COCSUDRAFT_59376 [Coccomyxa subellipsoidea C-169]EIE26869.1 hypothetical protein COCSUDRAFT_59376 [Coccomyxa subellipsoidea C-169]|eukprot:XP_005651413.1 hypothetical protein COCSUDRAFT_59376 [Coccomyxa subellipsoidea C-169]